MFIKSSNSLLMTVKNFSNHPQHEVRFEISKLEVN